MKLVPLLLISIPLAACSGEDNTASPEDRSGPPVVLTTFYPTTYFARRLAGDDIQVACPLPDGEDPIFWKPDDAALRRYREADLVIVNGAELEKWVSWAALSPSRVVDTARGFRTRFIHYESAGTHKHGPGGEHSHEGLDGHTWLDPLLAVEQARAIGAAFTKLVPGKAKIFQQRFQALKGDLERLDAALRGLPKPPKGRALVASHPAYNYLARRYGWTVINLDLDPDAVPDEAEVTEIAQRVPAGILLWESPPRKEAVALYRRILNLRSMVFSPCEGRPDQGDYLSVMKANVARLEEALRGLSGG